MIRHEVKGHINKPTTAMIYHEHDFIFNVHIGLPSRFDHFAYGKRGEMAKKRYCLFDENHL